MIEAYFRNRWLAYPSALVTIIWLVFGTFAQQLIDFKAFNVTTDALKPGNIGVAT